MCPLDPTGWSVMDREGGGDTGVEFHFDQPGGRDSDKDG